MSGDGDITHNSPAGQESLNELFGTVYELTGEIASRISADELEAKLHAVNRQSSGAPTHPADGQVCALFAVDIAGFTRSDCDDEIRLYLHEQLYEILHRAFDGTGIPWADCFHEDRGDGALIVVPPGIPGEGLIDPLPARLRSLIRRHNRISHEGSPAPGRFVAVVVRWITVVVVLLNAGHSLFRGCGARSKQGGRYGWGRQ
jgi:hypothetical protein